MSFDFFINFLSMNHKVQRKNTTHMISNRHGKALKVGTDLFRIEANSQQIIGICSDFIVAETLTLKNVLLVTNYSV